ncbi:MAG: hypothetical protein DRQ55_12835 [Planctomycetota bacterium]|nr:MAG: hypothetical protein DRQ55_12835 [Planctomycetota bacterium]
MPPWSYCRILLLPIAVLAAVFGQPWLDPWTLLADPVQWIQNELPPDSPGPPFYIGVVSMLGGLIWWTGAVACGFAGLLLRATGERRLGAFLLSAAAFTSLLALDDLLLIHDGYMAHFHVPEAVTMGAYGLWFLAHGVHFRREILATEHGLLALALVLLAASAGIDLLAPGTTAWGYGEESFKFLGLSSWCAYHCRIAWMLTRPSP